MSFLASMGQRLASVSLVRQIVVGIIVGALIATISPGAGIALGLLGSLFVAALKAVAPILVFVLVVAAIANQKKGEHTELGSIIKLYILGTFLAALVAVVMSYLFPTELVLSTDDVSLAPPQGLGEVLHTLLFKMVDNPVNALLTGNFIGILVWAIALGVAFHRASEPTRVMLHDFAEGVTRLVRIVIRFAPLGIMGLVANTIGETGFSALWGYAHLLAVLLGCMLIMALVVNPAIVYAITRENPYPLVLTCLRESGVTAFFTRSSAANIPVNLELCHRLGLHEDTYSVSNPLGATINLGGAAITITVLTLATVHTLGIDVSPVTALLLSLLATLAASGASGVAGGSLLLIPLATSLFGIDNDIAMQVVAVGFIIGVVQDSAETALNSSTDVVFTAAACHHLKDHNHVAQGVTD